MEEQKVSGRYSIDLIKDTRLHWTVYLYRTMQAGLSYVGPQKPDWHQGKFRKANSAKDNAQV